MSNLGGYQDIVVEAHKAGGTEQWLDAIKTNSYNEGVVDTEKDLISTFLLGAGFGTILALAIPKIAKWFSSQKKEKLLIEQKAKEAEKQLKEKLDTTISEPEEK